RSGAKFLLSMIGNRGQPYKTIYNRIASCDLNPSNHKIRQYILTEPAKNGIFPKRGLSLTLNRLHKILTQLRAFLQF
ncbi:MAG: hypothetical protein ABUJ92_12165, partial [Desulfobacterales bacterium]